MERKLKNIYMFSNLFNQTFKVSINYMEERLQIKIILLGDSFVGKTSIIQQY